MAFRYTLQTLLRLRQGIERQEELRLFAVAAVVARVRADMEHLNRQHVSGKRASLEEMARGSCGAILQFAAFCDAAYEEKQRSLQLELNEAERKRSEQLRIYKNARQKREILGGLRERQESAYDLEFARRDQQQLDTAFLMRTYRDSRD